MFNRLTRNNIYPFALALAFVLICAFPLFKMEYSTDTYHFALQGGLGGVCGAMIYNGRLLIFGIARLFELMGVNIVGFYYISFIMALVFSALSVFLLFTMLKNHMSPALSFLLAVVTILNPMCIEYFLFIEKGFFTLAIFMAVLGVKCFCLFLQGKRPYILPSYVLLSLCAFTYQPICAVFASLALVFILIYSKGLKEIFINTLFAISVYGFGTFTNFIVMKSFDMTLRMEGGINLSNVYKLLTFGIYFAPLLLVYALIFLTLFVCVFASHKKRTGKAFTKESGISYLRYSFIIIGTICATCAPCVFSLPEHVWFTLRFAYPIGTLVGTIPILCNYKRDKSASIKPSKHLICLITAVFILLMVICHSFYFSRHITNQRDWQDAEAIGELIAEYESKTGIEVKKVSIYFDKSVKSGFDGTVFLPNCNVRALTRDWCDVAHLSLILNRDFGKIENDNKYSEYFISQDFNNISESNAIFENDEMHLCVY